MKRLVKFLVFVLVFLLALSIFAGFMTYDSDKNASKDIFSSQDLLNKISIQKLNRVKLAGSGVENIINSSFSSYNNSKISYSGCNVIIYPDNKAFIKLYLKNKVNGFPTSVSFNIDFTFSDGYLNISITKASFGKLPVPRSVLRLLVKNNKAKLENISSTISDIDSSNLSFKLDLNSLVSRKQKIFIIKNISTESNNIILDLSINLQM
jgi:hypothetical protein